MNKEMYGTILALLAAVVSGISIPVNKIFVVDLDPAVFTAARAIIIGIIFLALSLIQKPHDKKQNKKDKFAVSWKYLLSIAIVGGSFAFLLFFSGLQLTTAGHSAFLQKTLPIFVAVFAYLFLKEKISKKQVYAMLIMFAGMVVIFSDTINPAIFWLDPRLGDVLIVLATILWAAETVISKKAMINGETNFMVSFARMFFGGLILFGVVVLSGKTTLLLSITSAQLANICISVILLFLYVYFFYSSLRLINASKAAVMLLLAPVLSVIFGIMMLSEPLTVVQIVGSALILVGAYLAAKLKSENRSKERKIYG